MSQKAALSATDLSRRKREWKQKIAAKDCR